MLRLTLRRFTPMVRQIKPGSISVANRYMSGKAEESVEAFDARWEAYFDRVCKGCYGTCLQLDSVGLAISKGISDVENIDDWEIRKGVNELYGHDLVPEPRIVNAMLRACRRLDDFAMAVRVLEIIKLKSLEAGDKEIYNYIIQSCKPTIDELGVSTVEDLGLAGK